jgi:hypothetical protein
MQYLCDHFTLGESCLKCYFGELHDRVVVSVESTYRCCIYHIFVCEVLTSKLEYEMKKIIGINKNEKL